MDIKVKNVNGVTLYTAEKYCKENINITLDLPKYDGSFLNLSEEITDVLPSGYTKLNYIESTGEQYLDTEFNMTINSEIELTMAVTEYNSSAKMGNAFGYCRRMTKLIIRNMTKVPPLATNSLQHCYRLTGTVNETYNPDGLHDGRIYVPDDMVETLKSATNWSEFADVIVPLSTLEE